MVHREGRTGCHGGGEQGPETKHTRTLPRSPRLQSESVFSNSVRASLPPHPSRGLLAVALHPLELLAVKRVAAPGSFGGYGAALKALAREPGRFFQGWRSTFLTAAFFRSPYFLGVPGVVRVRRMMEDGGDWDWKGR